MYFLFARFRTSFSIKYKRKFTLDLIAKHINEYHIFVEGRLFPVSHGICKICVKHRAVRSQAIGAANPDTGLAIRHAAERYHEFPFCFLLDLFLIDPHLLCFFLVRTACRRLSVSVKD